MGSRFDLHRMRQDVIEGIIPIDVVIATSRGEIVVSSGETDAALPSLSLAHPLQVAAILSLLGPRIDLGQQELAAAASWSTEGPAQQQALKSLFTRGGTGEEQLQCGPRGPGHPCAPFHAFLQFVSRRIDAPTGEYRYPRGKLQSLVLDGLLRFMRRLRTEVPVVLDACGLPTICMPPSLLAALYACLADGSILPPPTSQGTTRLMAAIRTHPDAWAGEGTVESHLLDVTDGDLVTRPGEWGLYAATVRSHGWGIVVHAPSGDSNLARFAFLVIADHMGLVPRGRVEGLIDSLGTLRNDRGDVTGRMSWSVTLPRRQA